MHAQHFFVHITGDIPMNQPCMQLFSQASMPGPYLARVHSFLLCHAEASVLCAGAVVVQTARMQSPAADRRSFLLPYDDSWQHTSRFTEQALAAIALSGFVAAFAVRIAGRSRWFWRMLRKHAGGTKGLMVLEHGVDSISDVFQTKNSRRMSKPG